MNPIELSLFSSRVNAVCEEMGARLQAAAFSPNIRDRLDFSCAIFDWNGQLCAQAAHIPVHLGSMAFALEQVVTRVEWREGQMVLFNDPFLGGTHLPDLTLIQPLFIAEQLLGFIVNRAHHADIGAEQPGSMPVSTHIEQEGVLIKPVVVGLDGKLDRDRLARLFAKAQNPLQSFADLAAQASANLCGLRRLTGLIDEMGKEVYCERVQQLHDYGERMMQARLNDIPDGVYKCIDVLDDDGQGNYDIPIHACVQISAQTAIVDFSGSSAEVTGNVNCPISVTAAAVYYVFRCLFRESVPLCAGTFRPLRIIAPEGSLLNARFPAAVVAGNVETSSRIVDVLFGALAQALPDEIPACSQGTMNNLAMGSAGPVPWSYYETLGGGAGATAGQSGASGIQTHMTNTRNTPIEILEQYFPLRVRRYALRDHSGGMGLHCGGQGLIREYEFLEGDTRFTILSERRRHAPAGIRGGGPGRTGRNLLNQIELPAKCSRVVAAGDVLTIETPGGGGCGTPGSEQQACAE